jgi:hypothetical protein
MIKQRLRLVRYLLKDRRGLTMQGIIVSIVIGVVVLVIAGLIYMGLSGKLSFFVDVFKNLGRFGQ